MRKIKELLRFEVGGVTADRPQVLRSAERVRGGEGTLVEASLEPADTLCGRAVCEAIGIDPAGPHSQEIITYRRRGVQGVRHVALIHDFALSSGVSPDSGIAVGLQFEAHG